MCRNGGRERVTVTQIVARNHFILRAIARFEYPSDNRKLGNRARVLKWQDRRYRALQIGRCLSGVDNVDALLITQRKGGNTTPLRISIRTSKAS